MQQLINKTNINNTVTGCQGNRIPGNINPLLRNVNAKHCYIHGNG
jgi:hypothetical protein